MPHHAQNGQNDLLGVPPHDPHAEQCVLGGCLIDGATVLAAVRSRLAPGDLYQNRHQRLYEHMLALLDAGEPVDLLTVEKRVREQSDMDAVGGMPYLLQLGNQAMGRSFTEEYAREVAEKAQRRRWIDGLRELLDTSYSPAYTLDDLAVMAQGHIAAVLKRRGEDGVPLGMAALEGLEAVRVRQREGKSILTTWGFGGLDRSAGGIPAQLVLVAARPSIGKTAFVGQVCVRNARASGNLWAFVSQETPAEILGLRAVMAGLGMDGKRLRTAQKPLSDEEWDRAFEYASGLLELPVLVFDQPGLSASDVARIAYRCKARADREGRGFCLVVDYLQLLEVEGRPESRNVAVGTISRKLAQIALGLKCPVVAISQLNRSTEHNRDRRPQLSELRDSGTLEQDARMVVLLHRPDFYRAQDGEPIDPMVPQEVEIIFAKNSEGPTGVERLAYIPASTRFVDANFK